MENKVNFNERFNKVAKKTFYSTFGGLIGLVITTLIYIVSGFSYSLLIPFSGLLLGIFIGNIFLVIVVNKKKEVRNLKEDENKVLSNQKNTRRFNRGLIKQIRDQKVFLITNLFLFLYVLLLPKFDFLRPQTFAKIFLLVIVFFFVQVALIFYSQTRVLQNALKKALKQIVFSYVKQLEKFIYSQVALEHSKPNIGLLRLRSSIMIFSPKEDKLIPFISYNLSAEESIMLISPEQDVIGKAFTSNNPSLMKPYSREKLGFTDDQLRIIPKDLEWKYAYPLRIIEKTIGVFAVDCNIDLGLNLLNEVIGFSQGFISALITLISQYPSKIIQDAFDL